MSAPTVRWLGVSGLSALFATVLVATASGLLASGIILPVGPSQWDILMYLDGNHRLNHAQVPHRDFFLPFGSLSLYSYHWVKGLFPSASSVWAASLPALLMALPLLVDTASGLSSRRTCLALWVPFAALALLPVNFLSFPEPFAGVGASAFGIYNRQAGLLLYALVAATFLPTGRQASSALVVATLAMLAFVKISALVFVLPLVVWALVTRRLLPKPFVLASMVCCAILLLLEFRLALVSGYLADLRDMMDASVGDAKRRLLGIAVREAGLLLLSVVPGLCATYAAVKCRGGRSFFSSVLSQQGMALGLLLLPATGMLVESQNTGSQTLAFLCPAMIAVGREFSRRAEFAMRAAVWAAVGVCSVIGVQLVDRTARLVQGLQLPAVEELRHGPLAVSAKPSEQRAAHAWLDLYESGGSAVDRMVAGDLAGSAGYGAIYRTEEHVAYLLLINRLPRLIEAFERANDISLVSVASLDFVDGAPMLLGKQPVAGLPVVFDPGRMLSGRQRDRLRQALSSTSALLETRCNAWRTYAWAYRELARPLLESRKVVQLDSCWRMYLLPSVQSDRAKTKTR